VSRILLASETCFRLPRDQTTRRRTEAPAPAAGQPRTATLGRCCTGTPPIAREPNGKRRPRRLPRRPGRRPRAVCAPPQSLNSSPTGCFAACNAYFGSSDRVCVRFRFSGSGSSGPMTPPSVPSVREAPDPPPARQGFIVGL
jgi:hypothetical protein